MEARDLEANIQRTEISSEPNIYTSQITQIDEHGMLHDTSKHEPHAPDVEYDIRSYVRHLK